MKNSKKNVSKKDPVYEEEAKQTLNYNDRLDGYGFGEADSEAESDPTKDEEDSDSENESEYGPVDQYTFRVAPIGGQHEPEEKTERDINQEP